MATLLEEIKSANEKLMSCFASGDLKGLSQLYTEDCKLMPPGEDVVRGRAGAEAVFGSVIKAGAKRVKLEIDEVGPMGSDTAFERSHSTFYKEDDSILYHGKYVVIWKKQDGKWFLYTDIFNSNKSS